MSNPRTPKKRKQSQAASGYNVGPKAMITTLYVDQTLHESIEKRAEALDMSVSKYLTYLAKKDLGEGNGGFTISPPKPA